MLETLKKNSFKKVIVWIVVLYIAAAGCMLFTGGGIFKISQKSYLYDLDASELEGKYVTADIYFIYDYYAYTSQTTKGSSRSTTVSKEYIIPVGDNFIGLYLPSGSLSKADALMKSSQKFLDGLTDELDEEKIFVVTGTILPMEEESLQFFKEAVGYDEMNDEDKARFLPYYLREDYMGRTPYGATILLTIVAVVCAICATVMLVRALTGAYQKDVIKFCEASGEKELELERMSASFETSQPVGGIRIADNWMMFQQGAHTRIWSLDQFVWAYKKSTEHRRNGIKTGTTFATVICNTAKRRMELPMSEQEVSNTLEYIAANAPAVILGFNSKLDKMYRNDLPRFQRILIDPEIAAEVFEPHQ